MVIDGHTPGIVQTRSQPWQYNFGLIGDVLASKQNQFDTAFLGIQKLRKEALSIQFLNNKEQEKVDSFNQKVGQFFDNVSDYGDLSDSGLLAQYTSLFNEIGSDKNMIQRYRKDSQLRQGLMEVEEKRNADDPFKAGYHPINHANYMRRLEKYRSADLDKGDVEVAPYTNYVDINTEVQKLVRQIPQKKFVRDRQMGNGYIERRTYAGRDPNQVRNVVAQYLQGNGSAQLREQAEYYYNNSVQTPEDQQFLYGQHQSRINEGIRQYDAEIQRLEGQMVGMTGDELTQTSQQLAQMQEARANLTTQQMSFHEFASQSDEEHISQMYGLEVRDSIAGLTDAYGGYAESVTYEPDRAFLALQNYNLDVEKYRTDTAFKQQELTLDQQKIQAEIQAANAAAGIPTQGSFQNLALNNPTTLDPLRTYDILEETVSNMANALANPFTTHPDGRMTVDPAVASAIPKMWDTNRIPAEMQGNIFVRAYHKALNDARRMGKDREAAQEYAHNNVVSILSSPQDEKEIALFNEHQDMLANQKSLANIMERATNSGDPAKYMEQSEYAQAFRYNRYYVNPDYWKANKAERAAAEQMRGSIANDVTNIIGIGHQNNVSGEFRDMELLDRISPDQIDQVEIHTNGDVEIVFNESLFEAGVGEPGDSDYRAPGPLYNRYYASEEEGLVVHKPVGRTMRVNVPSRSTRNLHKSLGLYIDHEPQTRYVSTANGPVAYDIVQDIDGTYMFRVNGMTEGLPNADRNGWVSTKTTSPERMIDEVRNTIQRTN